MRARQILTGQNEVDARRYGIRSSTTADQTSRFQDMADDLSAGRSGARTVILPAGEFHVSGSIDFDQMAGFGLYPRHTGTGDGIAGLIVKGQGKYATKIIQDTAGVSTFRVFESSRLNQVYGVGFEGFSLVGPGLTNAASRGIQLGGVSTDDNDIIVMSSLKDILFSNFANPLALDDVTNLYMELLHFEGYNYGIEFGFNVDAITAIQCSFGSQVIPVGLAATTSIGSPVVTGITTTLLVPGMRIISSAFPRGTTILTVDSATQITASANATSVVASLDFAQGVALSYGKGPFVGAWPSASTGNGQAHKFIGCWFMRNAEVLNIEDNTTAMIQFDTSYFERNNRIATLENATPSGPRYVAWENCHFSQPQSFQDYAIYENLGSAGEGMTVLRNCRCDAASTVPWIRLRSGSSKLDWNNNILPVSSGARRIHVFDSTTAYNPIDGTKFSFGCGGDNIIPENIGVSGSLTPVVTPKAACAIKIGPMTGAVTINDINAGVKNACVDGQRVRFTFVEDATAGHAVTWGAAYHFHTAWTNSTLTTDANKRSFVEFEYTGSVWMQVSPANTWLA